MKIQLDTTEKTIKIEEKVNLGELVKILDKLLPNKEWKQYELETNTVINNWGNTIYYKEYPYKTWPWYSQPNYETTSGNNTVYCTNNSDVIGPFTANKGGIYGIKSAVTNGNYTTPTKKDVPYTLTSGVFNIEVK